MASAKDPVRPIEGVAREVIDLPGRTIVTFAGHTYAVPKDRGQWSIDVMEALEAQPVPRQIAALELLLGPAQWETWRSRHSTLGEVRDMYEEIGKVTGGN